jgi:hypothetical protein
MGILVGVNDIDRLLRMRGQRRLQIKNKLTDYITEYPFDKRGVKLQFLESINIMGEEKPWEEYKVLLKIPKIKEDSEYLGSALEAVGKFMKDMKACKDCYETIGIQEIECGLGNYYFVLIYLIN